MDIYDIDVVEIPTNHPLIRRDDNDVVYNTEEGKYRAVVDEIAQVHATGQPLLVGTISVERSEYLSGLLKRRGIRHEVLNAKYHAKEAEIVAQAGKLGQVTIATNMAGRGTDILLGGNPEFLARRALRQEGLDEALIEEATGHAETEDEDILAARRRFQALYDSFRVETEREHEQVVALGGLRIIGTERHESRRIDNQLRGRAGRQGDPGSTRFYVSLEDELMRRFGADRVSGAMEKLSPNDDLPIEMRFITRRIESAQRRVEVQNFEIRKNVLRYDDVMNKQREIIYGQRRRVLMGEDLRESILEMLRATAGGLADEYCNAHAPRETWDVPRLGAQLAALCGEAAAAPLMEAGEQASGEALRARAVAHAEAAYAKKEAEVAAAGADMREIERVVLLRTVDAHWMDHIDAMDQLKQGIGLRAYAQKDPVNAYTSEGFDMFDAMVNAIREQTARTMLRVSVRKAPLKREQLARPNETPSEEGNRPVRREARAQIGRNSPCPCGSGKKYKNCCGRS